MRIGLAGTGRIGAFHASTLAALDAVDEVVVTDVRVESAAAVATDGGHTLARDLDDLLSRDLDGLVVATSSDSHASVLRAALAAGVPTFCEKPVATSLEETVALVDEVEASGVAVQVGFQRRFDAGYVRAREAVTSGELGFVHTVRANTHDQSPPPPEYLPRSGGLFRDCNVHDFDVLRFVTGHEVVTAYAAGGNKGADFFRDAGDVDTAAALLTLDDGTLVTVTSTRYHGAGHDVRMEVAGSEGTIGVGYDDSLALRSAEEGASYPAGPVHHSFMDRFLPAYRAELTAFVEVARGERPSPCTVHDALQAFRTAEACDRSRREGRIVHLDEVPGA